jgi:CheY-like chemotaxis protein
MMEAMELPILLVEDDPNDQALVRRAFVKAKLTNPLQMVDDGDEAVRYLQGDGGYADRQLHPLPSLILLDLKLPRRSGLDVLEWIRAQPSIRRIPVVVLTSSADSNDIARAYDLGANSYLVKPLAFEGLLELLRTVGLYWMVMNTSPTVGS